MADDTRVFEDIERAQIDTLRSSLATFVALPEGDRGRIAKSGFAGTFDYDERLKRLTLTIAQSPMFVPRSIIWSTIEKSLNNQ
ncbi:MAG: hypothetical protein M3R51_07125 [Candidatus Eremiobacteraeota bacterium]|nr:hypothetical protein [Candidatus Eremiobacteraeota bacterium]